MEVRGFCLSAEGRLTHTLDAVSQPTVSAATLEAPGRVDAGRVHVAVMSSDLALVDV